MHTSFHHPDAHLARVVFVAQMNLFRVPRARLSREGRNEGEGQEEPSLQLLDDQLAPLITFCFVRSLRLNVLFFFFCVCVCVCLFFFWHFIMCFPHPRLWLQWVCLQRSLSSK